MNYTIELKNNWKIIDFDDIKVNIDYAYGGDFTRDDFKNENIKLDIREHRRYNFEHDFWLNHEILDLDFTWESEEDLEYNSDYEQYKEEIAKYKKIQEEYYVFGLDFFEHTTMSFSLTARREYLGYYEFDRSRDVWIIAVKKDIAKDEKDAMEIAAKELEMYNARCNGWIYQYSLDEKEEYFSKDLHKKLTQYEYYDGCTGFLDFERCKEDAMDSVKCYLNSNGIEYDSLELVEN